MERIPDGTQKSDGTDVQGYCQAKILSVQNNGVKLSTDKDIGVRNFYVRENGCRSSKMNFRVSSICYDDYLPMDQLG